MAKMEFGELDQYLFGQATHYDIYKKLGAHPVTQNGKSGTYFAVWAPNAEDVSMQAGLRCARAMHPVSRISQVSNGAMPHG